MSALSSRTAETGAGDSLYLRLIQVSSRSPHTMLATSSDEGCAGSTSTEADDRSGWPYSSHVRYVVNQDSFPGSNRTPVES